MYTSYTSVRGIFRGSENRIFAAQRNVQRSGADHIRVFLRQHESMDGPYGNAFEILLNLLSQLINYLPKLSNEDRQRCSEVDPADINSIAEIFGFLISSLSNDCILVIVIDGLRFFADPPER